MRSTSLSLSLVLLLSLFAFGGNAPDDTKPADIEHMKKIGAALNAYKKAKGEFPDHLSDLVPDFLDAKTLVSPLGVEADPRAVQREYDPKLPCTYCYEFGTNDFLGRGISFRALKTIQLQEYGPTLPLLRCFIYKNSLNLSHGGDFFESEFNWEDDPETTRLLKKNGLGPGAQLGKKLVVTLVDAHEHPVPGVALSVSDRTCYGLPLLDRDFTTDATGQATVPLGIDSKPEVVLTCRMDQWFMAGGRWTWGDAMTPEKGETATLTAHVHAAAPMKGIVRDAAGQPIANAGVAIHPVFEDDQGREPDLEHAVVQTVTGSDGHWSVRGMPKDGFPLLLVVHRVGHATLFLRPTATSSPTADELFAGTAEMRLADPFPVKGTIRTGGQPIRQAKVHLFGATDTGEAGGVTDDEGRFQVLAETPGKAAIVVTSENFAPYYQLITVGASAEPLALTLDAGRTLKGRVVRGRNIGVPRVPILFNCPQARFCSDLTEKPVIATTDDEGRFVWPHAPRLLLSCSVLTPDGDPVEFDWDTTKDDETIVTIGR